MPEQRPGQVPAEGRREGGWTVNPRVAEASASEKEADVELYFLGAQIPN